MPRLPYEEYQGRWESYQMSDAPMVPIPDGTFLLPVCTTEERLKSILWALHEYFAGDLRDLEHTIDVLEAMPYINNPFGRDCVKAQLKDKLSVELCEDGQSIKILLAGDAITDCLPLNLPDCETETSNGDCGCNDDCGCCEDDCGDCGCNDSNEDCGCCDDCNNCGCEGHEMAIKDIEIRDGYLWKINCNGSEEKLMPLTGDQADIAHELGQGEIENIMSGIESATGAPLATTPKISCIKATNLVHTLRAEVATTRLDGSDEPDVYGTLLEESAGIHFGGALTGLPSLLGYIFTGGNEAANAASYSDSSLWDGLICTLTDRLSAYRGLSESDIDTVRDVLDSHEDDYINKAVKWVWDASQKSHFRTQVLTALLNPDAPCECTSAFSSGSADASGTTFPELAANELRALVVNTVWHGNSSGARTIEQMQSPGSELGIWTPFGSKLGTVSTTVDQNGQTIQSGQTFGGFGAYIVFSHVVQLNTITFKTRFNGNTRVDFKTRYQDSADELFKVIDTQTIVPPDSDLVQSNMNQTSDKYHLNGFGFGASNQHVDSIFLYDIRLSFTYNGTAYNDYIIGDIITLP